MYFPKYGTPNFPLRIFGRVLFFSTLIAQKQTMARTKKVSGNAAVNSIVKTGRPVKEFGLKDTVKLVRFHGEWQCQSCHGDCKKWKKILCTKRDFRFCSYAYFVPAIFLSKVLINKIQPVQALHACLLEDTINVHTLRYHVQKERAKVLENADSCQVLSFVLTMMTRAVERNFLH